jgi:CRISPR-associated protein Cas1
LEKSYLWVNIEPMIKKTLYFGNPAYLSLCNNQLVIKLPELENSNLSDEFKQQVHITRPMEDIGVVVLDNKQITITSGAIEALLQNNCALITCDSKSMPTGLMLPLYGNTTQNERFRDQLDASVPLKKQLWQQTVKAKIENQASVLKEFTNTEVRCMQVWANDVKSGDSDNVEAHAAAYYWKNLFASTMDDFIRDREGMPPNNLLNYGYSIIRAVIARNLVASGMLPTLGIHHHNKYNAYCLADDIMEPYRPYVDELVFNLYSVCGNKIELSKDIKAKLLTIPTKEVIIEGKRSPLMIAAGITTATLYKCFSGEMRRISYPER